MLAISVFIFHNGLGFRQNFLANCLGFLAFTTPPIGKALMYTKAVVLVDNLLDRIQSALPSLLKLEPSQHPGH